jgi:hypothetical protein
MAMIATAMLSMSGRVTMRGLSRWAESGGSYRSVQRFFQEQIEWAEVQWLLLKAHVIKEDRRYLLAGDEVVVSKSGKKTHGLGRFYSSLAGKSIPSLSFLSIALLDLEEGRAYPLQVEQMMPQPKTQEGGPPASPKPRGRPKGSKNHVKAKPILSADLQLLQGMLRGILGRLSPLPLRHMVLDGKYGNYPSTWAVQELGLHLISKMRHNAELYLPYAGSKPPSGPTPRYGKRLSYAHLDEAYRLSGIQSGEYQEEIYHLQVYHKDYPALLNVVVLVKTQLKSGRKSHVILFSTDLSLSAQDLISFYSLRFQIEFTFRDAKQFWGLEDFMNVSERAVTNAVNLSFFMVNLSTLLLRPFRLEQPTFSVLDLKASYRARRYLIELLILLPDPSSPDLVSQLFGRLSRLGAIRSQSSPPLIT